MTDLPEELQNIENRDNVQISTVAGYECEKPTWLFKKPKKPRWFFQNPEKPYLYLYMYLFLYLYLYMS